MDAQTLVADSAPLIALVQCLARLALEDAVPWSDIGDEVLAENRFLAARDGVDARLIDPATLGLVEVRALVDALLALCRPHAAPGMRSRARGRVAADRRQRRPGPAQRLRTRGGGGRRDDAARAFLIGDDQSQRAVELALLAQRAEPRVPGP